MFLTMLEVSVAWVVLVAVMLGMLRAAARADQLAADEEREMIASLRRLALDGLRDTPNLVAPRAGAGRARPLH